MLSQAVLRANGDSIDFLTGPYAFLKRQSWVKKPMAVYGNSLPQIESLP